MDEPNEILLCTDTTSLLDSLFHAYRTRRIHLSSEQQTPSWVTDHIISQIKGWDAKKYNYKQRQQLRDSIGFPNEVRTSQGYSAFGSIVSMLMEQKKEVIRSIHVTGGNEGGHCILYGNALD